MAAPGPISQALWSWPSRHPPRLVVTIGRANASSQLSRGFGGGGGFGPAAMMSTLHFERTLLNGEPEGL